LIRLLLVRHGNTFEEGQTPIQIGALTDLPLTSFGKLQAEQMAQYLIAEKIHPKAIFAGHLKRQIESARLMARPFHMPILNEPALTEIDYGDWEGLTSEEIAERWPKEYAAWTKEGKWAERIFRSTAAQHKSAIDQWLEKLKKTYAVGDTIVAVSSNGLLRFFQNGEKVKTGHFCDITILPNGLKVNGWNLNPKLAAV